MSVVDEDYIELPTLMVGVKKATKLHTALLDSGANANIMSFEAYVTLKNKKAEVSSAKLSTFDNHTTDFMGEVIIDIHLQGHPKQAKFYLAKAGHSMHDLILGRSWLFKHKCSIDWEAQQISLTVNNKRTTLPMPKLAAKNLENKHQTTTVPPLQNATFGKNIVQASLTPKSRHRHSKSITKRWVPKYFLKAQGFHQGKIQMWLSVIRHSQRGPTHNQRMANTRTHLSHTEVINCPILLVDTTEQQQPFPNTPQAPELQRERPSIQVASTTTLLNRPDKLITHLQRIPQISKEQ